MDLSINMRQQKLPESYSARVGYGRDTTCVHYDLKSHSALISGVFYFDPGRPYTVKCAPAQQKDEGNKAEDYEVQLYQIKEPAAVDEEFQVRLPKEDAENLREQLCDFLEKVNASHVKFYLEAARKAQAKAKAEAERKTEAPLKKAALPPAPKQGANLWLIGAAGLIGTLGLYVAANLLHPPATQIVAQTPPPRIVTAPESVVATVPPPPVTPAESTTQVQNQAKHTPPEKKLWTPN